jgi:hypothetical protein
MRLPNIAVIHLGGFVIAFLTLALAAARGPSPGRRNARRIEISINFSFHSHCGLILCFS